MTYRTLLHPSEEVLYKDKGSKFYGYAFPIKTNEDYKEIIEKLKQKHSSAGHFCFAYQHGIETLYHRASDDGEPSNSAGLPIYGQLQAFDVTNVLVVGIAWAFHSPLKVPQVLLVNLQHVLEPNGIRRV